LISLKLQFSMFLIMILTGVVIGFLYDFYRALRGITRPRSLATNLGDALFVILLGVVVLGALMFGNWCDLRFYAAVGLTLGFLMYMALVSSLVLSIYRETLTAVGRGALKLVRAVTAPLRAVWRIFRKPVAWVWNRALAPLRQLKARWQDDGDNDDDDQDRR